MRHRDRARDGRRAVGAERERHSKVARGELRRASFRVGQFGELVLAEPHDDAAVEHADRGGRRLPVAHGRLALARDLEVAWATADLG